MWRRAGGWKSKWRLCPWSRLRLSRPPVPEGVPSHPGSQPSPPRGLRRPHAALLLRAPTETRTLRFGPIGGWPFHAGVAGRPAGKKRPLAGSKAPAAPAPSTPHAAPRGHTRPRAMCAASCLGRCPAGHHAETCVCACRPTGRGRSVGLAEGTRGRHTPPLAATVRGIGHAGRTLVAER